MRVRTFFTIGNQHTENVFYGMYMLNDTTFAKSGGGHEGWVDAGKAIDMEVDFPECKIVFWKDKPVFGFGTKLADPKKVTTDRPVTLTKQKTVVQPAEPDFSDPNHVGPVVFMTAMDVSNLARGVALAAVGKIPAVGGAIAGLMALIWAEQKRDLIAESEDRMRRWVQGRFADYDRSFLRNTLAGLQNTLNEYQKAGGRKERARWYDLSLAACEQAMPFFTKDKYTPGTVALAASLGTIHLALLRERVLFGREILDEDDINEAHFRQTLKERIEQYQTFITDTAMPGELKWRQDEIADERVLGETRYLTDWVTREVHRFKHTGRSLRQGPSQVCVDYYREQAGASLQRQLQENVVHTAQFWTLLDPDHRDAHPIALDSVAWNGPLAGLGYMVGNEHNFEHGNSKEEHIGRITEIVVWAGGDRISGLQFNAEGRPGRHYGGSSGTRHVVTPPAGTYVMKVETWFDFDLWAIRFHFSDGSPSPIVGKKERGGVHQTAQLPLHHVTAVRVGGRLEELRCGFTPLPDYYDRISAG